MLKLRDWCYVLRLVGIAIPRKRYRRSTGSDLSICALAYQLVLRFNTGGIARRYRLLSPIDIRRAVVPLLLCPQIPTHVEVAFLDPCGAVHYAVHDGVDGTLPRASHAGPSGGAARRRPPRAKPPRAPISSSGKLRNSSSGRSRGHSLRTSTWKAARLCVIFRSPPARSRSSR